MNERENNKKFRKVKEAPEGGWGYLVCLGLALPASCGLGSLASFGLLYNDFLEGLGAGTTAVTTVTGSFLGSLSFSGFLASVLFKKFEIRTVGIFGSVMFFLGSLSSVFVTRVEHLILSYGILQGIGFGFMMSVMFTTFNHYFVKRRILVMSLTQVVKGVGIVSYPIIVRYLVNQYGFRGAAAVIAAIHSHAIFAMLTMHPIRWHYKIIKVPIEESKPLMDSNGNESIDVEKNDKSSVRNSVDALHRLDELIHNVSMERIQVKRGKWQKVVDLLDLSLFKDFIFLNIAVGLVCALYSDSAFFSLLPIYLFKLGFDKSEAALLVSIGAFAEMGARIFIAIMSVFIQLKPRYYILIGTSASILIRFVFLNMRDFTGLAITTALLGFFRTWIHITSSLVVAEHSEERFASSYGMFLFFKGTFTFIIAPFIGWIRDTTNSYGTCFNALTIIMSLCTVPWFCEMFWLRLSGGRKKIKSTC